MSAERRSGAIIAIESGQAIVMRGPRHEGVLVLAASTSGLPQMLFLHWPMSERNRLTYAGPVTSCRFVCLRTV